MHRWGFRHQFVEIGDVIGWLVILTFDSACGCVIVAISVGFPERVLPHYSAKLRGWLLNSDAHFRVSELIPSATAS